MRSTLQWWSQKTGWKELWYDAMMPPTTPCIVLCGDSSETLFVPRLHPVHAWCEWFVEYKHAWALCGTSELSIDLWEVGWASEDWQRIAR